MKSSMQRQLPLCIIATCSFLFTVRVNAQTEHDAIMMNKGQWCNGISHMQSQWKDYWEGTFKRNNDNIGTLHTRSVMFMTNYGIGNRLNIMAGLPYVRTEASKGTLHGMQGVQDASLSAKWKLLTAGVGNGRLSLLAVVGVSTPLSHYAIDFLPLSIGLGATSGTGRIMADYQHGSFFTTVSGAYVRRGNVKLDRTSYYTTAIHITNEVRMPDVAAYDAGIGIRKKHLVAEALLSIRKTLSGFDIRKNDMPFPSNRMNSTTAGAHIKYTLPFYTHVELTADAAYVVAGRNVGQATTFGAGAYFIFSFHHHNSGAMPLK